MRPVWTLAGAGALTLFAAILMSLRLDREHSPMVEGEPMIEAGRAVYIAEGCIHCHSQYVRPVGLDDALWGPVTSPGEALAQKPVLIGNRRQGPDLANVGLRRSPDWNRRHLIDPRAVSPGSRMPAYAHLFEADGARGEALLAYLDQLRPALKDGSGTVLYESNP